MVFLEQTIIIQFSQIKLTTSKTYLILYNIIGIYIVVLLFNYFFIIFLLFWILFYCAGFYIKRKKKKDKIVNYECGFLSFNTISFNINFSFFISASMVLIYELEFLILLPIIINKDLTSSSELFLAFLFMFTILITVIFDSNLKIIKWMY